MRTTLRWTFFLLCVPFMLHAQQTQPAADTVPTPGTVWNLKQCVDYALANSLQVRRSEYDVENSEIDLVQSKIGMAPTINGRVGYDYRWGLTIDPTTNTLVTRQNKVLSPGISGSVPLYNGFNVHNSIKQYSKSSQAAGFDLQKSRNDVTLNVASLYITVVFDKEQLENAKSHLATSQHQNERTRKQVAAGALPRSNELNLDAQVATNEVNVVTRENNLALSLLRLKQALQLPAGAALDVEVPQIEVEDLVLDQSRDQIFDAAHQTMPEIKSADLKVESSYYAVKAARGRMLPSLSLGGSIGSNYASVNDVAGYVRSGPPISGIIPIGTVNVAGVNYEVKSIAEMDTYAVEYRNSYGYREQLKDNLSRVLSLTLTIPILNGFQSRATWQRAVVRQKIAEVDRKEISNTLRQNVETAYNDAVGASKTYNSSLRQVQARDEAYRMTKQRFEAGATNYVEYQVAENDLFQAKSDLVRAKYDFIFKKKVLDFYQGKPLAY